MNIKTVITSVLVVVGVLHASLAFAQSPVPPNVSNVQARFENNQLIVNWNPVEDSDGIAYYRIYFSRQSILQNNGDYDDYERTNGPDSTYTFPSIPYRGATLYFSVLAVDNMGNESDAFEAETSVVIPGDQQTSSAPIIIPDPVVSSSSSEASSESSVIEQSTDIPFVMTHALTYSGTQVKIYFSKPIAMSQIDPMTVQIIDNSGANLAVMEVMMETSALVLKTEVQIPDHVYTVASVGSVAAQDASPLMQNSTPIQFQGYPMQAYGRNPNEELDVIPPEDASNVRIGYKLLPDGTYDVILNWDPSMDSAGDLSAYVVSTSRDGTSFGTPSDLSKERNAAEFKNVPPGIFGALIKAKDNVGNISEGIANVITLPQTGVGLLGMIGVSGAVAGYRALKKKSARKTK